MNLGGRRTGCKLYLTVSLKREMYYRDELFHYLRDQRAFYCRRIVTRLFRNN